MKPTLLLATNNPGKVREVCAVLADLDVNVLTPQRFPDIPPAEETGDTFEENARLKALHFARATQLWTLADDSGLEVDALGGEPGVWSARYAGPQADDAANNARLIERLREVAPGDRNARFRCVMALADPRRRAVVATAAGTVEGRIVDTPRGHNGFGYDPHFYLDVFGATAAELPPETKNRISHRGRALRAIRPAIQRWVLGSVQAS